MYTVERSTRLPRASLVSTLAMVLLSSATAALGAGTRYDEDLPRVVVHFEELDISKAAGARVLYRRIERAAATVCLRSIRPLTIPALKYSSCYRDAIDNAVAQVESAQLQAIHRAHSPRLARQ